MRTKSALLAAVCLPLMLLFTAEATAPEQHHRLRKRQIVYNSPDDNDLPGTWCYQCQDRNSNETACAVGAALVYNQERVRRLLAEGQRNIRGYGIVDCKQWADYCVIEEVFLGVKNGSSSYYRDCSDGQPHPSGSTSLQFSPPPDNRTRCRFDEVLKGQVCLTLCRGDFCNGPVAVTGVSRMGLPACPAKWLLALVIGLFYKLLLV